MCQSCSRIEYPHLDLSDRPSIFELHFAVESCRFAIPGKQCIIR